MKPWLFFCLPLLAVHSWGACGVLETLDGHKWSGEIQFRESTIVVIGASQTNQVPLTNLGCLRLQSKSAGITNATPGTVPTNGLLGLYFNSPDLTGPFQVRYDPVLNFEWGEDSPMPGVKGDGFSVRWVGTLVPETT